MKTVDLGQVGEDTGKFFYGQKVPPLLEEHLIENPESPQQLNKKVGVGHGDPSKYYNKELKLAKSLALVLVLFAASWLPLHILNCITLFSPGCEKPMFLLYIAILLTHGNSAVNPIVYAFRIKKFRTAFQRLWKQYFCCKEAPPIDTQMSERLDKDHFCPGTPLEHNI